MLDGGDDALAEQKAEDRRQRLKGLVALELTAAAGLAAFVAVEDDHKDASRREFMALAGELFDEAYEGLDRG